MTKEPERARELRRPAKPAEVVAVDPVSAPADPRLAAAEAAVRLMFDRAAGIVAAAVLHAGGTMPIAYSAAFVIRAELAGLGHEILSALGLDITDHHLRLDADPNWGTLAAAAGQAFDKAGCQAILSRLPYYADADHPGFV